MVRGSIWYISDCYQPEIPEILCSAVDRDHGYASFCSIKQILPSSAKYSLQHNFGVEVTDMLNMDTGLAFGRLNPYNFYHTLFEDLIPIHQILKEDEYLSDWLSDYPKNSSLILFQDHNYGFSFSHDKLWSRFFPNVTYVVTPPKDAMEEAHWRASLKAYRVKYLVAGSNNSCAHYFHCSRGEYTDPYAVSDFRRFVFEKVGVTPRSSRDHNSAKVTIIRGSSRKIRNIDDIVGVVAHIRGETPDIVDLEKLSLDDQIKRIHDTDILIMMHGAAIAHLMFMAEYATIFEFFPFGWPLEFRGLENWVRFSLPDVPIRLHQFDIRDPRHMYYGHDHPLPLCVCDTSSRDKWYACASELYFKLSSFEVDITRFEEHLSVASNHWDVRHPIVPAFN